MTTNLVKLPTNRAKSGPARALKFTATSLRKTTAAFDAMEATGIILRDSEARGLI